MITCFAWSFQLEYSRLRFSGVSCMHIVLVIYNCACINRGINTMWQSIVTPNSYSSHAVYTFLMIVVCKCQCIHWFVFVQTCYVSYNVVMHKAVNQILVCCNSYSLRSLVDTSYISMAWCDHSFHTLVHATYIVSWVYSECSPYLNLWHWIMWWCGNCGFVAKCWLFKIIIFMASIAIHMYVCMLSIHEHMLHVYI